MIAPGIFVDLGRAAEFSNGHYQDIVQKTTLLQILQQGGYSLIERREANRAGQQVIAGLCSVDAVTGMIVPDVGNTSVGKDVHPRYGHQAHARLDEAPGQQETLTVLVAA